jgi:hypothetical protein
MPGSAGAVAITFELVDDAARCSTHLQQETFAGRIVNAILLSTTADFTASTTANLDISSVCDETISNSKQVDLPQSTEVITQDNIVYAAEAADVEDFLNSLL